MANQLAAESVPRAVPDRLSRRRRERTTLGLVTHEVGHPRAEINEVARPIEPSVDAAANQIDRPACARRDDGNSSRESLLNRLTERLALAGVNEDIEGCHRLAESVAGQVSEKDSAREGPFERWS